jgi:hypothetical protein
MALPRLLSSKSHREKGGSAYVGNGIGALPFVLVLDKGLSRWIDAIDFERLKRVAVDVECVQSIVRASAFGQGAAAHRFDFVLIGIVPTFHDDDVLDMIDHAGLPVIKHAGALPSDRLAAAGHGLSCS